MASGWPSDTSPCTGDPPIPWARASRRSPPCRSCWLPLSQPARHACGSAPGSASCRSVTPSAPPKRPPPSIRSARAVSTSASAAAAFPAPIRATAFGMTRAAIASRNRSTSFSKRGLRKASRTPGKYFTFDNLTVVPRPYQKPHPPIWVAATTHDTFPLVGRMGFSLVTGLRGFDVPEAARHLEAYRAALREAGHPGNGNVYLRIPVYVAATAAQARSEPEESTMRAYRRLAENLAASVGAAGTTGSEERGERAARLSHVTYDDLLRDRVAYGTPDMVVDRLRQLRHELGLSGVIMESNVGGRAPLERVLNSIRLYAHEVGPRLR